MHVLMYRIAYTLAIYVTSGKYNVITIHIFIRRDVQNHNRRVLLLLIFTN